MEKIKTLLLSYLIFTGLSTLGKEVSTCHDDLSGREMSDSKTTQFCKSDAGNKLLLRCVHQMEGTDFIASETIKFCEKEYRNKDLLGCINTIYIEVDSMVSELIPICNQTKSNPKTRDCIIKSYQSSSGLEAEDGLAFCKENYAKDNLSELIKNYAKDLDPNKNVQDKKSDEISDSVNNLKDSNHSNSDQSTQGISK